ncbi:MAG: hypothetical protein HPY44_07245 [Armatimonadetes bacterium]|nr:hypothetical protein [Armatimonadota bacterium]
MSLARTGTIVCLVVLAAGTAPQAAPDLRLSIPAGPLKVYRDDKITSRYYYPPGQVALVTDDEGRPDLRFLQMRYVGTSAAGDRGAVLHRSILTFRVRLDGPSLADIEAARRALYKPGRTVDLRPLPISRLDSALVYATVRQDPPQAIPDGHFEEAGQEPAVGYWTERNYTLSLDDETSQLFWEALQEGQVVLSLGYAFIAPGIAPEEPVEQLQGSPELIAEMNKALQGPEAPKEGDEEPALLNRVVRAGALSITADAARWPELFQRADINESLPPGYAVLEVRCYDFNNELRPDLYEKQVEIAAQAVAGGEARLSVIFESGRPELYARSIRFPVAVRIDKPYRYRVIEIGQDGSETAGEWIERESWAQMLDVTSPPKPQVFGDEPDETEDQKEDDPGANP